MRLARVNRDELPVLKVEVDRLDREAAKVDPKRVGRLAAQRRELVEQPGLRAGPRALRAGEDLRQLGAVGIALA